VRPIYTTHIGGMDMSALRALVKNINIEIMH